MKGDNERYVDTIKESYLRGSGSRKGKNGLEEFYAQLTPHELNLIPKNKMILDAGAGWTFPLMDHIAKLYWTGFVMNSKFMSYLTTGFFVIATKKGEITWLENC